MQNSSIDWITTKELAKIKGISERAVRKAISKNKYVIRKSSKTYEILITSLEENVRKKVTEHKEKTTKLVPITYAVPEEQKKLALAKYDLIKKWDEFRNNKKNKTVAGKDFLDAYNNNCVCAELFAVVGKVAIGTIYEWHKKLREYNDDWHCLINNYTFGEKTKKSALSEAETSELLKNLLHPNQLNIGKAIKFTKMALTQRGFKNLCCDLTYRRFANNYKAEHYDIWVEAREGNKALHDKVLPYISRDVSKLEVGDVIVGDGHRLAFFVKNPYTRNPVRPTLVAYQDWKSGGFVGFKDNGNPDNANIIHRPNDKLNGICPINLIQQTNPFVIIDEPQSVDNTPKAKVAIKTLNPKVILRYSATFRTFVIVIIKIK